MANTKAVTEQTAAVPPALPTGLDADIMARIRGDAAGGLSKDQADNLVPLIYVLQPLSPQVMRGDAARIEGAEAGDIWLRNSENPIIKSDKGMLFQPCYFYKDIVEWTNPASGRGTYVGRHDISCLANKATNKPWSGTLTDVKEMIDDQNPNKQPTYIRSGTNNRVVETRYFVGYVYPEIGIPLPFIIPLSSTGHSFGKQWMFLQNSQTLPDGTPIDKSWVILYRLKTTMKTNNDGSWYMYTVQKERMIANMEEYERGAALNKAFLTGEKKADEPDEGMLAGGKVASGEFSNDEKEPF